MDSASRMDATAERFAAGIVAVIENRVALALELERDRHDAQIAAHREAIVELSVETKRLAAQVDALRPLLDEGGHSMRVALMESSGPAVEDEE